MRFDWNGKTLDASNVDDFDTLEVFTGKRLAVFYAPDEPEDENGGGMYYITVDNLSTGTSEVAMDLHCTDMSDAMGWLFAINTDTEIDFDMGIDEENMISRAGDIYMERMTA